MPTPVSIARQCLTAEAAHALDEAVAVARRRGHGQTTSLHAVSALLSLPSSALREACARARGSGPPYPTRLQFKALELCLSVSLDRVPSGQVTDDPPVSNSLMAAIKRSQANQRRQPENFHLYHQMSSQSSINNAIKVELKQLIISILDDPVVSRVFVEAGFRSSEIKLAILRPLPHLLHYPARPRGPPLFFCSTDPDPDPGLSRIRFPFSVLPGFSHGGGDANCRRIGEVLLGRNGGSSNPLLIGACAHGALREFVQTLEKNNRARPDAILLPELSRFSVIDIESNISDGSIQERLDEVAGTVTSELSGEVLVVCFGDLKGFLDGETAGSEIDPASRTVARLTSLLEAHREKVRLIGFAASNDTYSKFVGKFPAAEKEWELQILPITTLRTSMAESGPRSSFMESFVPFAGFFSSTVDYNGQVFPGSPYQYLPQCNLCPEKKSERETIPIPKSRFTTSIADQYQGSLPSWLQLTELGSHTKARDDRLAMSTTVMGLQNEWGDKFQHVHQNPLIPASNTCGVDFQSKTIMGSPPAEEKSNRIEDQTERCKSVNLSLSRDAQKESHTEFSSSLPQVAQTPKHSRKEGFLTRLWEKSLKPEDIDSGRLLQSGSNLSTEDTASPASVTSTTTNLGQRTDTKPESQKLKNLPFQTHGSAHDISEPSFCDDYKAIYKALTEKVGRQQEAISLVSETIARSKARNLEAHMQMSTRGDVWLTFLGPDRMAKWKVAVSLCEILYGNREHLIHIDLSPQSDILNQRGKTPVDIIAGELSKQPLCVVFLENVDRADEQVQSSLLQAILTGKFSDSRSREIGVQRAIFLASFTFMKPNQVLYSDDSFGTAAKFSEEGVLRARGWPMKIIVKHADKVLSASSPTHVNKRKLTGLDEDEASCKNSEMLNKRLYRISSRNLDLNLPAENAESPDPDECSIECDVISDNSKAWLLDFIDRTDSTVNFKPYDFDSLAEKISKDIRETFRRTVGLKCVIEIESRVMEQLLCTIYRSDGDDKALENWVAQVLSREFAQLHRQHELTDHSMVRILTCQGVLMEDQVPGNCLPCRLFLD